MAFTINQAGLQEIINRIDAQLPSLPPELRIDRPIALGLEAPEVGLVQSWCCLLGKKIKIDQDYGPATARALSLLLKEPGYDGRTLTPAQFAKLIRPMLRLQALTLEGLKPAGVNPKTLGANPSFTVGDLLVLVAEKHLASSPRELGQNQGPWVEYYCGREGVAWCAGFVCTVLEQTYRLLGRPAPIKRSLSCDTLAAEAQATNCFFSAGTRYPEYTTSTGRIGGAPIPPGSLFIIRNPKNPKDWNHVGLVKEQHSDGTMTTIEGNTNDEGSREGYEVAERLRSSTSVYTDYIIFPELTKSI